MRVVWLATLIVSFLITACGGPPAPEADETGDMPLASISEEAMPLGRLGDDILPVHYSLELEIDPREARFKGRVAINAELNRDVSRIWLHGKDLAIDRAYAELADGRQIAATYKEVDVTGVARLDFDERLPTGQIGLYAVYSAPFMNSPSGLYRSEENGEFYAATQFQSTFARQVFPSFDEPGFKTPFTISVIAKSDDVVVTTTPSVAVEKLGDSWVRHTFETTASLPTYLLAFAVGPYDVNEWTAIAANDVRGEPLPLRGLATRGKGLSISYALEHTADMVHEFEAYFDMAHPYPKLDIIAAPEQVGAMENVGAIMYDPFIILMDDSSALSQRRFFARVHAHELAHQWFGNLVTPEWWDDIWLNESFASWIQNKIAAKVWPDGQFERITLASGLAAMSSDSLASARQIRQPVATNAEINDSFDTITYDKGGAVLAMFETYLGDEAFRDGVRTHINRYAHSTATADDFMRSLAEGSGDPAVVPAFRSFIEQPGVPLVHVRLDCDAGPKLYVRQRRYAPLGSQIDAAQSWKIPMCAALGSRSSASQFCALIDEAEMTLPLGTNECPSYVVPNGNGSGYFRFSLDEPGWSALTANADRLDASQAMAYADSLDAAFRAGEASASTLLNGLSALARHEAWDVLKESMARFEEIVQLGRDANARADLQRLGRQTYGPVRERLRSSGDAEDVLLRRELTRFLAIVALDSTTRADLLEDARAYIGTDGEPDLAAVEPDLVATALSVGVQEDGASFFNALLELVRSSTDPAVRRYGTVALARTEDPELSLRLLDAVAGDDFSMLEMYRGLFVQMSRDASREAAWAWLSDNMDRVLERSSGIGGLRAPIWLGSYFCDMEKGKEFEALIRSNSDRLPGYERTLAQSLEAVAVCAKLSEAKGEELANAAATRL